MFQRILAAIAALFLSIAAHAAIDVNRATQAELEAVKGIGPGLSAAIVGERKKGEFKDWGDLLDRVKGVGERNAVKFSDSGLTVAGKPYAGAPSTGRPARANGGSGKTGPTADKADKADKAGQTKKPRAAIAGASAA